MTGTEPTPLPLSPIHTLPAFPTHALPQWLRAEVCALAEFTQTPHDLAGMVALGVLSACAGGRAGVEVRPGWREPVNLYALTLMVPGSRKSPVVSAMSAPLIAAERVLADAAESCIVEARVQRDIAEQSAAESRRKASRLRASKDDKADGQEADAISDAQFAESIVVPHLPRLLADDATPEAIASLLADNGGRIAVVSAEGGVFDLFAGRYANNVPNLDLLLKAHSGDMLRVDRRSRPPEHVPKPALTLCLTAQPYLLASIARNPAFVGRGVLARMLYALPTNNVGHRKVGTDPVPEAVADEYANRVGLLAREMAGWNDPAVLVLTPEAAVALLDFERALEPRLAPAGDLGGIAEWASKLVGTTARLAGLLHLAEHPISQPISRDTMNAAIDLAVYFTGHALAAFDLMGADAGVDDARYVLDHLSRKQTERFTVRSLFTDLPRSRFAKTHDLRAALDVLEDRHWVKPEPAPERTGPGRPPSPTYLVNRAAVSAQYAQPPHFQGSADTADCAAS